MINIQEQQSELPKSIKKQILLQQKEIYSKIANKVLGQVTDDTKLTQQQIDQLKQKITDQLKQNTFFIELNNIIKNPDHIFDKDNEQMKKFLFTLSKSLNKEITQEIFDKQLFDIYDTLPKIIKNNDAAIELFAKDKKDNLLTILVNKFFEKILGEEDLYKIIQPKQVSEVSMPDLNFSDFLGVFKSDKKIQVRKFIDLLLAAFEKEYDIKKPKKLRSLSVDALKSISIDGKSAIQIIIEVFPRFWQIVFKKGNTNPIASRMQQTLENSMEAINKKFQQSSQPNQTNQENTEEIKKFFDDPKNFKVMIRDKKGRKYSAPLNSGDPSRPVYQSALLNPEEFKVVIKNYMSFGNDESPNWDVDPLKEFITTTINLNDMNSLMQNGKIDLNLANIGQDGYTYKLFRHGPTSNTNTLEEKLIKLIKPVLIQKLKRKQNGKKNLRN